MKLIVITLPHFYPEEADDITALFRTGLPTLHLRKPQASPQEVEQLLCRIPQAYHPRIVLHDFYQLAEAYPVGGIHLTGRHPQAPAGYKGSISCSCHTLEEAQRRKADCAYILLSPIFDSISKQGYAATFTPEELILAARSGIIDHRVVALGGITAKHLPLLRSIGFGGAALLGDVWRHRGDDLTRYMNQLLEAAL